MAVTRIEWTEGSAPIEGETTRIVVEDRVLSQAAAAAADISATAAQSYASQADIAKVAAQSALGVFTAPTAAVIDSVLADPTSAASIRQSTTIDGKISDDAAPRRYLTGPYTFREPDRLPAGKSVVGIGANSLVYMTEVGGSLRRSPDYGASLYNCTVPATSIDTSVECRQVYEWNGYAYTILRDNTDGLRKLYRAAITMPAYSAMDWAAVLTLSAGASGFGYTITSTATALIVGEYGDPVTAAVQSAKIRRSTNGTAWATVHTFGSTYRHVHCVAADPYNPGHVWAAGGDNIANHLALSTDHGATWSDVTVAQGWQATQISFTPDWVFLAPDPGNLTGSLFILDRATKTVRLGALGSHHALPIQNPGYFTDGSTTSGSTTFTDTRATPFVAGDVGRRISSTNIPAGTTIVTVTSGNTVVLSAAATATGTPAPWYIERQERPVVNCYQGIVDPATGIYYGIANDDAGAPGFAPFGRRIIFAVPYPGATPIFLCAVGGGGAAFIGGGKLWFGNSYLPLIDAAYTR